MEQAQIKFEEDIKASPFRCGRRQKRWHIVKKDWPVVFFGVRYAPDKTMCFRVNLESYQEQAPKGTPWHRKENRALQDDELLIGKTEAKNNRLRETFRIGDYDIYQPFDRTGISAHPEWATEYPHLTWNSDRTITFYLEKLHDLLN